jgi:hypothetical protein
MASAKYGSPPEGDNPVLKVIATVSVDGNSIVYVGPIGLMA